jgi:hypothetical protein
MRIIKIKKGWTFFQWEIGAALGAAIGFGKCGSPSYERKKDDGQVEDGEAHSSSSSDRGVLLKQNRWVRKVISSIYGRGGRPGSLGDGLDQ